MLSRLSRDTFPQQVRFYSAATKNVTSSKKSLSKEGRPNIVFVEGVRTPFTVSGTVFKDMMAVDLQREALQALVKRTGVAFEDIGHVTCGTVIQEPKTSNIAREAWLTAGFPDNVCFPF